MDNKTIILVADDDPLLHAMISPLLERWGYEHESVTNGRAAFDRLRKHQGPAIAILDWMMPEMEGIDVIRHLLAYNLDHYVYSILLTSRQDDDALSMGLDAGACDFLRKPFRVQELRSRIAAGLRFVDQQQQIAAYAEDMENLAKERAAQLLHADRLASLGVLAAGVAHEINNPAASLAGNIQLMEKLWPMVASVISSQISDADEHKRKQLSFALDEMPAMLASSRSDVKRISSIVSSLRLYARKDNGQMERCDLRECVDAAIVLCGGPLKKRVRLNLLESGRPLYFRGARQQIEQVLINLIINGADAMDGKSFASSELTLRTYGESSHVCVAVEDCGHGIAEENQSKLFTPFFTTKPAGRGTGLGLSLSRSIAQNHRGDIEFCNLPSGGARFVLRLPECE